MVLGELEEAIGNFKKAISITPQLISSYMRLSEIYSRQGHREKLLNLLELCVKRFPTFPDSYVKLSNLYLQMDKQAQAETILHSGMSQNPESPQIANNLAWYYIEYEMGFRQSFFLCPKRVSQPT